MTVDDPQTLLAQLKATQRLPSPAGTALRVVELCRTEDVELRELAVVIMSDPALSGRLLKYANCWVAEGRRTVNSVRDAVLLLGLRTVKLTALGFSLVSPNLQMRCPGLDPNEFWSDSFIKAAIARHISTILDYSDREEAFTAGLLAGIGRLAFAKGLPELYAQVLESSPDERAQAEMERRLIGVDHIEFGARLLADWELPERLVGAIEHQNRPMDAPEDVRSLARVLDFSARLAPAFNTGEEISADLRSAAREVADDVLKLDETSWQQVAQRILGDYREIADLFGAELGSEKSHLDLYAEAQEEANRVGIVGQLERRRTDEDRSEPAHEVSTDPLTGVADRTEFEARVEDALQRLGPGQRGFALILFSIDHFKRFHDTHGRQAGDLTLKHIARAVRKVLRDTDLLARYRGEKFSVVAPCADRKAACLIAARVHRCVEDLRLPCDDQAWRATVSVGMVFTTDYPKTPGADRLITDADEQLNISKQNGRNTWSYLGRTASKASGTPQRSKATVA